MAHDVFTDDEESGEEEEVELVDLEKGPLNLGSMEVIPEESDGDESSYSYYSDGRSMERLPSNSSQRSFGRQNSSGTKKKKRRKHHQRLSLEVGKVEFLDDFNFGEHSDEEGEEIVERKSEEMKRPPSQPSHSLSHPTFRMESL